MNYESFWNIGVMISVDETQYGKFYVATVHYGENVVEATTSHARHKDRAVAYALQKFAQFLIQDSHSGV